MSVAPVDDGIALRREALNMVYNVAVVRANNGGIVDPSWVTITAEHIYSFLIGEEMGTNRSSGITDRVMRSLIAKERKR